MRSPIKKVEKEGKQACKREEAKTMSSEEVPPLKKRMRGSIPSEQGPAPPSMPPTQATPRRESGQSAQSTSMNVDDFINLEALNRMIEEDNLEAARRAEMEREREKKEEEELKAAKAESLRAAKEEKKRRKAELRTKLRQEGTSTSAAPHSSPPQEQPQPNQQEAKNKRCPGKKRKKRPTEKERHLLWRKRRSLCQPH